MGVDTSMDTVRTVGTDTRTGRAKAGESPARMRMSGCRNMIPSRMQRRDESLHHAKGGTVLSRHVESKSDGFARRAFSRKLRCCFNHFLHGGTLVWW